MKRRLAALFCVGSLSAPTPASAHLVGVEFGDFYAGALHLLSAPEHVVALVAIALVAALHPRDDARWALLALPIGFIIGALAAWWTPLAAPAAALIAASLAAPGAIGAFARPMTARFLAGGVAIIAALHGFANAVPARAGGVDWPLYAGGVAAAGTVVGVLMIAAASSVAARWDWTRIGARAVSSWIAAVGVIYFGLSVATA